MGEEGAVLGEEVAFGKGARRVIKEVTEVKGIERMKELNELNEAKKAVLALENLCRFSEAPDCPT